MSKVKLIRTIGKDQQIFLKNRQIFDPKNSKHFLCFRWSRPFPRLDSVKTDKMTTCRGKTPPTKSNDETKIFRNFSNSKLILLRVEERCQIIFFFYFPKMLRNVEVLFFENILITCFKYYWFRILS